MAKGTQKTITIQDVYEVLAGNALEGKDGLVKEMRIVKKKLEDAEEAREQEKLEREKLAEKMALMQIDIQKIKDRPTLGKFLKAAGSWLVTAKTM